MRQLMTAALLLFTLSGCEGTDLNPGSAYDKSDAAETPSQIAADHATVNPSLNTVNSEGSNSAGHSPGSWINSPAGAGNSP